MKERDDSAVGRAPATSFVRRTAMRVLKHQELGVVAVYEQDPAANQAGTRALVFEWALGTTRLTTFPDDWPRMTDEQLVGLAGFEVR